MQVYYLVGSSCLLSGFSVRFYTVFGTKLFSNCSVFSIYIANKFRAGDANGIGPFVRLAAGDDQFEFVNNLSDAAGIEVKSRQVESLKREFV